MQYLNRVMSIDPGDHIGFAYWKGDLYPIVGQIELPYGKAKLDTMETQLAFLWSQFSSLLTKYKPTIVYIEGVEFWMGSLKSVTAAKRNNLSKLSYVVGGYSNEAMRRGIEVRILPASQWKGQMSKEIVMRKINRINGQVYQTDHISDAVGIGMSRMGYFLRTKNQPKKVSRIKKRGEKWD